MGETILGDALARLAQHRLGEVDADDPAGARVVWQRESRADANLENAPADPLARGDGGAVAALEDLREHDIVDRRPPCVGLGDRLPVEFSCHGPCLAVLLSFHLDSRLRLRPAQLSHRLCRADATQLTPAARGSALQGDLLAANSIHRHRVRMAQELACAHLPGMVERERAAVAAGDAERSEAGLPQVVVQHAYRMAADDIPRAGDRIGRHRHAAGQRLQLHDAEGVGLAGEHEHVGRRQVPGQHLAFEMSEEHRIREAVAQIGLLRPVADHHLGAGQVEREERLQVLLDGDAPDADEQRARQVERYRPLGPEQLGIDAAGPQAQVPEAALRPARPSATAWRPW